MSRRKRSLFWSVLLGLPLAGGCVSMWPTGFEPGPTPSVPPPTTQAQTELPPEKAAKLCLDAARAMEQDGSEADAIQEYEKARRYDPHVAGVSRRLAVLYDRQGDDARSLKEYRKCLQEHPHDAALLNDLGCFYYHRGNWSEAEKYLRQAVTADAHLGAAWGNLGKVLGHEEHYDQAYEAFTHVNSPAEARSNVGVLLAKNGHIEEAKKAFQEALRLQPELTQAQAFLAVLEQAAPGAVAAAP